MLTRFTTATCPHCGHTGKPTAKDPGNETTHSVLNFVPLAGIAYTGWRGSQATLHCTHCGAQLTDSLTTKAAAALDKARDLTAAIAAIQRCPTCSHPHPPAKFCPECGAPQTLLP